MKLSSVRRRSGIAVLVAVLSVGGGFALAPADAAPAGLIKMFVVTSGTDAAVTVASTSAQASSITCSTSSGDSTFSARCGFPGPKANSYRAVAGCSDGSTHFGAWHSVNSGIWSTANCGTNKFVTSRAIQITS
jgi:hypothetical protein